jgi:hypothetical protein
LRDRFVAERQHGTRAAWPRTGPIGRLARLLMAALFALALNSIADQGWPASFRDHPT